jgi:hypothetical protein
MLTGVITLSICAGGTTQEQHCCWESRARAHGERRGAHVPRACGDTA